MLRNSVICGAETWEQMHSFAKSKEDFLRKFLELPNGIPSKHTINRVFSSIDHGQVKTDEKSNEITAIPKLLELLDIENNIVTIDAMGTQVDIANKIIEKNADYILAVKGNQEQLLENIEDEFKFLKNSDIDIAEDLGHGRIEKRVCTVVKDFQFIEENSKWTGLKSVIKVESTREFKNSEKPIEKSTRYYISSLSVAAKDFQNKIRSHWAIENKLHWVLDVAFSEDSSRKRAGNASENYAILTKIALNLLKNETSKKLSMKSKRLQSAWDNDYLAKVINVKV